MCVRRLGRPQQTQPHEISARREAVLGVVQDRDAVSGLGQVGPLVAADFEFGHVPGGIVMCRPPDDAELRLV